MQLPIRPTPATREAILHALASHTDYKSTLEGLLLDLDEGAADALMLLLKESRGAYLALLRTSGGRALFVGNAFSGTIPPLANGGFQLVVVDRSPDRLAFSRRRDDEYAGGRVAHVLAGADARLPFADGAFDLVVQEDGLPHECTGWGHAFEELCRVSSGEVVLTADNRLAYKRSVGMRGRFHVPGPLEWLARSVRPTRAERSLGGYKRLFAEFDDVRAFALYPHAREFSHVVSLDADRPRLTIGPRERKNPWKMAAARAGLVPLLTPSFAVVGARSGAARRGTRIERVLAELAERLDESPPRVDIVVATRSNDGLVHTSPAVEGRGDELGVTREGAEPGWWTLHIPLSPQKRKLLENHHRFLRQLFDRAGAVSVPEPLFAGEIDGLWLSCERRLPGLTAPHITGDLDATQRMFQSVAEQLATLTTGPATALDEARFDALVTERIELVRRKCEVASTARRLDEMLARARVELIGRSVPLVTYHADLRSKHVQVRPNGEVVGYLDWGASEDEFLPYVDLLHLIAHQRKQEIGGSAAQSWALVRERADLRPHEARPLDVYADRIGLDGGFRRAVEELYPALVAGMAERNWDYSRPRWVHRQYGL